MTAVDFITPTLNRPDVHEALYDSFASQRLPQKRLFVLDESKAPSPFFAGLKDARVVYRHEPNSKITKAGQGGIARARNRLIGMGQAPIVAHLDDDDWYSPDYGPEMSRRLGSNDIAKSVRWQMRTDDGHVYEWDSRRFGGRVWAVKGGEPPTQVDVDTEVDPQIRRDMQDAYWVGFGFTYVYSRSLWERFPFPEDEQTEDIPWIRRCRSNGARIVFVDDLPHLCMHTVHARSESVNFPQKRLAGIPQGMVELPRGKAIEVIPGKTCAVLATLKTKHSLPSLAKRAAAWGVSVTSAEDSVSPAEFGVAAPQGGYRLVYVTALPAKPGRLPWAVPAPLNVFDRSSVLRAWRAS